VKKFFFLDAALPRRCREKPALVNLSFPFFLAGDMGETPDGYDFPWLPQEKNPSGSFPFAFFLFFFPLDEGTLQPFFF